MSTAVTPSSPAPTRPSDGSLRDDLADAARALAATTWVGALAGVVVVGVLGRLAMALLAALNHDAHGVVSDDGFVMGQVTLSGSFQLALAGLQLGTFGAFFYLALRWLLVGPAWFRLLSISLGPAVVVGSQLVHSEGVDFVLLEPLWLAVALFVLLPGLYAAALHLGAEWALPRRDALPLPLVVVGLLPWAVLFPATLAMLAAFLVVRALRTDERGRRLVAHPAPRWLGWAALTVLFVLAVVDLTGTVTELS